MRVPVSGREPATPTTSVGVAAVEASPGVFTLLANTTYFAALGGEDASQMSFTLAPANALLITSLALEVANNPAVSDISTTAGDWLNTEPGDVEIEVTGTMSKDTDNFPLAKANGAGTGLVTMPTFPWRRGRLKIVVGATGGALGLSLAAKG